VDKDAVYLNGGPQKQAGAAGLPDGSYYVKVESPQGTLLGTSVTPNVLDDVETPVRVTNGVFELVYQLSDLVYTATSAGSMTPSFGYLDTDNLGGEYKVTVSASRDFDNDLSKTDNFKIRSSSVIVDKFGEIGGVKFYDANMNGKQDNGEVGIPGFRSRSLRRCRTPRPSQPPSRRTPPVAGAFP
jgi:hypothetical protein